MTDNFQQIANKRNSNIELLRCFLMFGIIFMHLIVHGINGEFGSYNNNPVLQTTLIESFFLMFSQVGVDCYILISGYFGINFFDFTENKIYWSKLRKSYLPVLFYSVTVGVMLFLLHQISMKEFVKSFLPVVTVKWWFATSYIFLIFISPFLNYILDNFARTKYFVLTLASVLIFTYFFQDKGLGINLGLQSLGFSQMVLCYLIGGMLKRNDDSIENLSIFNNKKTLFLLFFVSCLFSFFLTFVVYKVTGMNHWWRISINSSPVTIFAATTLFLLFKKIKMSYLKFVNIVGATTFGIYLIHTHPLLDDYLYQIVYRGGYSCKGKIEFVPYMLLVSLAVFISCGVIEFLRTKLFSVLGKLFNKNGK